LPLGNAALAILIARQVSHDEELINIVAAGVMSKSSVDQSSVPASKGDASHDALRARVFNMNRGFVWTKA
jgi:hypothetical protein